MQEGLHLLETRGDPRAAARVFERAAAGPDRTLSARARLYVGVALETLGRDEARRHYERVVTEFADQPDVVREARTRLAALARTTPLQHPAPPTTGVRRAWSADPPGLAMLGRVSRDGRVAAYLDDEGGVALAELPSWRRAATVAAPDPSALFPAVPSPDGAMVAWPRETPDGIAEVRVGGPGRPADTVLRLPAGDALTLLEWSVRDRLLFEAHHPDGRVTLSTLTLPDRSVRVLAGLENDSSAAMSPDGRFVVYVAPGTPESSNGDLFLITADGGAPVRLVGDPSDDTLPAWTARGDRVLFVSDRTGSVSLWSVPITNGRAAGPPALLQHDLGRVTNVLGMTADGAYYYLRQVGLADVYVVPLDDRVRASGAPARVPARIVGANLGPSFSSDGRRLAYLAEANYGSRAVLGITDLEQGTSRSVATGLRAFRASRWSPDGRRLLTRGWDGRRYGLFLLDPETGSAHAIFTVPPQEENTLGLPRWTGDGQVVYKRWERDHDAFHRLDPATTRDEPVLALPAGEWATGFDVARDDAIVACAQRDGSSSIVVGRAGGTWREIVRVPATDGTLAEAVWGPDGRTIYFVRSHGPSSRAVWRVGVDGGTPEAVGVEMPSLRAITVSPDGRRLAFTSGDPVREPWMVEHFLPERTGR